MEPGKRKKMKEERIGFFNAEGYADPTAFIALNRIVKERNRKKTYLDRGVPSFPGSNPDVDVKPKREILHIKRVPVFNE